MNRFSKTRFGYKWLFWLLMNALGFSANSSLLVPGLFLAWLSGDEARSDIGWYANAGLVGAITGLIGGLLVGTTQWLVILRDVPRSLRWVWRTAIGFSISYAFLFSSLMFFWYDPMVNRAVILLALVSSMVIGVMQWSILRKHFQGSKRWIWANCLGWAMNPTAIVILEPSALRIIGIALMYGVVTGAVLVWLLNHPMQCENSQIEK